MKPLFCLLTAVITVTAASAQTNAPAPAERAPAQVFSDSGDFDLKNRITYYHGHVRVDDPEMKMTCDEMMVKAPETGGRVERIVAEGHVVIDMVDENNQTNHATGQKMVYIYKVENSVTNDTADLTGDPRVDQQDSWLTGDEIIWDRITGTMHVIHQHIVSKGGLMGNTNQPPRTVVTNQPSAAPATSTAPPAPATPAKPVATP